MRTDSVGQEVFGFVLSQVTLLLAPIAPFVTERIWQNLMAKGESVHLANWPVANEKLIDETLENAMRVARAVVAAGLAKRKELQVAVKQPMAVLAFETDADVSVVTSPVWDVALEELNVFNIAVGATFTYPAEKVEVSEERLKQLGEARGLVRSIQALRKEKGCTLEEHITVVLPEQYKSLPADILDSVKAETLTSTISWGNQLSIGIG
jgi:valyl-tRNA synthetase